MPGELDNKFKTLTPNTGARASMARLARETDLVISFLITVVSGILAYIEVITFSIISPPLIAGIFTVIIGAVGTLFSILILYGEVISRAREKSDESRDYFTHLRRTFQVPVKIAVIGFIISVLSNAFDLNTQIIFAESPLFTFSQWFSLIMTFLLIYAILSFWGAFSFVLRTVIALEAIDSNSGKENSR